MRLFFLIAVSTALRVQPKLCRDCKHMIGREPGRCALFPDIVPDDFLVYGIKNPIRFNFTPCAVARRYSKFCGKKAKCFREREENEEDAELLFA